MSELFSELMVCDSAEVRRTGEGYLVARPRMARTGIQDYLGRELGRPDLQVVRVYRPDNEVFQRDSAASFAHRPITLDHPFELVDSKNWKKYAVGQTDGEVIRDGDSIRVPMMLLDKQAIADYESGARRQLSAGYTMTLAWEPGKTPTGEAYDAVQMSMRINHIALVASARGGPQLRIGDSIEPTGGQDMTITNIMVRDARVAVSDEAAPIILKALKACDDEAAEKAKRIAMMEEELARLKGESKSAGDSLVAKDTVIATKDAEITTLRQQLVDAQMTPQKLDQIVKDRAEVIAKATKIIGTGKVVTDGKTTTEIMRQVVDHRVGAAAKDWKDEQIRVSFDTLTAEVSDALADALSRRRSGPVPGIGNDARTKAYNEYSDNLSNAWKTPAAAQ